MPYLIRGTNVEKDAVRTRFYPEFPMAKKRPFLNAQPVSQAQKDEIPRTLLVKPAGLLHRLDPLPELLWVGGFMTVYPPMKALIEKLEPGVHEFIPLEVKSEDGSASFGTYYLVLITQEVDAVVYEETRFSPGRYGREADKNTRMNISGFGKPVLRTDAVRGYHLWRGAGGLVSHYFCSDEIGQFVKDNKLRGWRLDECVMHRSELH